MSFNVYIVNLLFLIFVLIASSKAIFTSDGSDFDTSTCTLSSEIRNDIQSYTSTVEKLRQTIQTSYKTKTYDDLTDFINTVGPRLSGSKGVQDSISYLSKKVREKDTGLKKVHQEPVQVPKQKVGTQSAEIILANRKQKMEILPERAHPLNTPITGILAQAVVVNSLQELRMRKNEVFGKILVLNFPLTSDSQYIELTDTFDKAALEGHELGAVAVLIRSILTHSFYTPADYISFYAKDTVVASITVEDAEFLRRVADEGILVGIRITIVGYFTSKTMSSNLISDYEGTTSPEEFVIVSGHMDTVKVGLGALDDGTGLFLSLNAIRLLHSLNLRPRRTMRLIFWTGEEFDFYGSKQFAKVHEHELRVGQYRAALEPDLGCGAIPQILSQTSKQFQCILSEILETVVKVGKVVNTLATSDVTGLNEKYPYVPTVILADQRNGSYFWYHHTAGDMMTAVDANDLDTCLFVYTSLAFILSDMETLPRTSTN